MRVPPILLVVSLALLASCTPASAQISRGPAGHWEGVISTPMMGDVAIGFDLAKKADGRFLGTFDEPQERLRGMPLLTVIVEGEAVTIDLASEGGGRFEGLLGPDGATITGDFNGPFATVPFSVTRKGDARFEPEPKGATVSKDFEGAWTGTLDADDGRFSIELHLVNLPDGTSRGVMISVDEGRLEAPVQVVQKGANLQLSVGMTGGSYSGNLDAAGAEIAGTYINGQGRAMPLTFKR